VQVTVVMPTGKQVPEDGEHTTDCIAQLSLPLGVEYVTTPQASFVPGVVKLMLLGQVTDGFWVSLTVTVNEQLAVLLDASLTVHETVVVPLLKVVPEAGVHVGVPTPEQLSLTVGAE
jgi:hypothetical protein